MEGVLWAILGAIGFGSASVFARLGLKEINTRTGTAISVIVNFIIAGILTLILELDGIRDLSRMAFLWFIIAAILTFPLARVLNYQSVRMLGAAKSAAIVSTQPMFSAILAILILHETSNWFIGIGTVAIVLSVMSIVIDRQKGTTLEMENVSQGIALAVCSAFCYALTSLTTKIIVNDHTTPLIGVTGSLMFGSLVMVAISGKDLITPFKGPKGPLISLILTGVSSGVGITSTFFAMSYSPIIVVAPLLATYPVFTLALSPILLRKLDILSPIVVISTITIVIGVVLIVFGNN